jgi:DNA-binding transcriptional MerR regulator
MSNIYLSLEENQSTIDDLSLTVQTKTKLAQVKMEEVATLEHQLHTLESELFEARLVSISILEKQSSLQKLLDDEKKKHSNLEFLTGKIQGKHWLSLLCFFTFL